MDITTLIVAVLGSGTIGVIFKTIYDRICHKHDEKDEFKKELALIKKEFREELALIREELETIKEEIKESQRDRKRQQLLTLMYHDPTNIDTIMAVAKVYFRTLDGNWYMDSQFSQWMKEQGVEPPSWFKVKEIKI